MNEIIIVLWELILSCSIIYSSFIIVYNIGFEESNYFLNNELSNFIITVLLLEIFLRLFVILNKKKNFFEKNAAYEKKSNIKLKKSLIIILINFLGIISIFSK